MINEVNFLEKYQKSTKRDYVERVVKYNKAECAAKAKQWGFDYWDGDRGFGYGGYRYDNRWRVIADDIAAHYNLKPGDKVLDIGCGKAYLLYELTQSVPGIEVSGIDISQYAIDNSKEEIRDKLQAGNCTKLPWDDNTFDFVFSINTFHNLYVYELQQAVQEMQRVAKAKKWCCVESYRNEQEKANLLYWQLTCESFYTPNEWKWLMTNWGYQGDCGFIYFQ